MMSLVRLATMVLMMSATTADAQSPREMILTQLQEQGFAEVQVSRTLLGRLRFVATSDDLRRELIINPVTGQILRDRFRRIGVSGENGVVLPEAPEGSIGQFQERREKRQENFQDSQEERQDRRQDRREQRQYRRDTNG